MIKVNKTIYAACLQEGDEIHYTKTPRFEKPVIQTATFVGWLDDTCTMPMFANVEGTMCSSIENIASIEFFFDEDDNFVEFIKNRMPKVKENYVDFLIQSKKVMEAIIMDNAFEGFEDFNDANAVFEKMSNVTRKDNTPFDLPSFLNLWKEGYGKGSLEAAFELFTGVAFIDYLFEAVDAVRKTINAAQKYLMKKAEDKKEKE